MIEVEILGNEAEEIIFKHPNLTVRETVELLKNANLEN
jgi:hypothetical protein